MAVSALGIMISSNPTKHSASGSLFGVCACKSIVIYYIYNKQFWERTQKTRFYLIADSTTSPKLNVFMTTPSTEYFK